MRQICPDSYSQSNFTFFPAFRSGHPFCIGEAAKKKKKTNNRFVSIFVYSMHIKILYSAFPRNFNTFHFASWAVKWLTHCRERYKKYVIVDSITERPFQSNVFHKSLKAVVLLNIYLLNRKKFEFFDGVKVWRVAEHSMASNYICAYIDKV